jgi:DNA polymerase-3 subunit epsilon
MVPDKPIVFFDLETTGVNVETARVTQIAAYKIWPGEDVVQAIQTLQRAVDAGINVHEQDRIVSQTINPECTVDSFVLELTHLTQEQLNSSCTFAQWAPWLQVFFDNAVSPEGQDYGQVDWAGYNITKFDNAILEAEFRRATLSVTVGDRNILDSYQVFAKKEGRTLTDAARFYCDEDIEGAHNALVDIQATLKVMHAQTTHYEDMPGDNYGICMYGRNEDWLDSTGKFRKQGNDIVISIGKHAGTEIKKLAQTQAGYLKWMICKDFPADAKKIAQNALEGIFPDT